MIDDSDALSNSLFLFRPLPPPSCTSVVDRVDLQPALICLNIVYSCTVFSTSHMHFYRDLISALVHREYLPWYSRKKI